MSSRVLRWVIFVAALAALSGTSYKVWELEQRSAAERNAADVFERQARQVTLGLADLRAALQAYVADGQVVEAWRKTQERLYQTAGAQASALRAAARSPEGQGAVESAVENLAGLSKIETRATEFLVSAQRLSASDVVFTEASAHIATIVHAVDTARGHESVFSATLLETIRIRQLSYAGGSAAIALLALLLLAPLPKTRGTEETTGHAEDAQPGSALGIGHIVPAHGAGIHEAGLAGASRATEGSQPVGAAVSLADTAAVCVALAKVQEPRELPELLERAAAALNAVGLVVWMPDGPNGMLRPALAHGYAPLAVTRMGTIAVDADNATAVAYRTSTAQVVSADAEGPGAVAAPLITADGCSGVMAAEIKPGTPADSVRDAATIIAAQLATLISPPAQAAQRPV